MTSATSLTSLPELFLREDVATDNSVVNKSNKCDRRNKLTYSKIHVGEHLKAERSALVYEYSYCVFLLHVASGFGQPSCPAR